MPRAIDPPMREIQAHQLDARHERFALARASGLSVKDASRAAGVSSRTGACWGGLAAVKARVASLSAEIASLTVEKIATHLASDSRGCAGPRTLDPPTTDPPTD